MGQEACKSSWPKPAGGYQTITGRRYGRRHAYVSFRPSLESPNRTSSQQIRECEGLELDDVLKEKDLFFKENCDLPPYSIGRVLTADVLEEKGTDNEITSVVTEAEKNDLSHFSRAQHAKSCQTLGNCYDGIKNIKTLNRHSSVEHTTYTHRTGKSFVNIDSFEPDSSEGEENGGLSEDVSLTDEIGKNQKIVDLNLSEHEEVDLLSESQSKSPSINQSCTKDSLSQMRPVSLAKHCNIDLSSAQGKWNVSVRSVSEDDATGFTTLGIYESQQRKNKIDVALKTTVGSCHEIGAHDAKADQGNLTEPVVRPKIRKQATASSCSKNTSVTSEGDGKEITTPKQGNREYPINAEKSCKDEKTFHDMVLDPINLEGARKKIKNKSKEWDYTNLQVDKPVLNDPFRDAFEAYSARLAEFNPDEDSSDCSDGEWSTCLPSYFSSDKDHSSSDESWETLPGKEEHDVQSNSSSLEEENSDFCFQAQEQTSLEDGEIPWLQYEEDVESSTDEENEIGSHFVHPGFFMLDSNNNLEDDSSMSEDLEVEWRLLDDFGDGLGVAQAMSFVDPQFLTYMALEERLAQAMETALAHLESLAVDVEQAHPPATKESIDCLPQIIITDDHNVVGQEQCCAICCSEYIKDEILTELPCHHLFHKPCVTLWLQKSGTCPVCRHVLVPLLPEAAAPYFLSDHESPPSIHSAAGLR
ncbi:E3 ubiquitin-protein ligase Praja-2 [Rhinophrynus dorsalis]